MKSVSAFCKYALSLAAWMIYTGTIIAADAPKMPLPGEGGQNPAITMECFPDRLHAFVFKNWPVVPVERLATVLETEPENVTVLAKSMGLPEQNGSILKDWSTSRGYITVLRRNWHLLPYDQLLTLLGMSREELGFRLQEDDFLIIKLGNIKPFCKKLVYTKPTPEATAQAEAIARCLQTELGPNALTGGEERFEFINRMKDPSPEIEIPTEKTNTDSGFELRYISSYFASFGEPLLDPEIESCPEGLLQRLAAAGVNGVWFHTVLRTLVPPSEDFPEFGQGHEQRIAGLNKLVQRAKKYGIGIYLYSNEPRAMPNEFFNLPERQNMKGVTEGANSVMCLSDPRVQKWLVDSYKYVFKNVPDLAGVFTITASENLTTCASHGQFGNCPRCSKRSYAELIDEVNTLIAEGVRRGNPNAKTIVWDWGWNDQFAKQIINGLPKDCWFQSVSEWDLPITRGGVSSRVGEYSLSAVGPGPRAQEHWKFAKEAGLKTVAKVQVNLTWEFSVIPHLPVLNLVAQHAHNLAQQSVNGVMLSWSLGGYPSENLMAFQQGSSKNLSVEENLKKVALHYYGPAAEENVLAAWKKFSTGFAEYPYHGGTLYSGPQHAGPSNPLYWRPTGYSATMTGIPYDQVKAWCSIYPVHVWIQQMALVRDGFEAGCAQFEQAIPQMTGDQQKMAQKELNQYRAAQLHFASCVNQATYTQARDHFLDLLKEENVDAEQQKALLAEMRQAVEAELKVAKAFFPLVKADSSIGYESANHYFYIPQDIAEKVINCHYILKQIATIESNLK